MSGLAGGRALSRLRPTSGRVAVATVLLVAECLVTYRTLHLGDRLYLGWTLIWWMALSWILFAAAAYAVMRCPARAAVLLIVPGAIALQLIALSVSQTTSNDANRYVWDGRVQAAGFDPYEYSPIDPALNGLHDNWLFPPGKVCATVPTGVACPNLNHPTAHTIYPPVGEAYFYVVHLFNPDTESVQPIQIAAAITALAVTGILFLVISRTGGDKRRVVLWAWCPTVVIEAGNNGHVDVVAALLVVAALGLLARRKATLGGLVFGLAVATKLLPVLLLPVVIRRRPIAVSLAALAAIVAVYLPHVVAVGSGALGFLPGYVGEEDADQFALLRAVLPPIVVLPAAALLLAAVCYGTWRQTDPDRPWLTGAAAVSLSFLIVTPSYSWYALLIIPLVALGARTEWLLVVAAMVPVYLTGTIGVEPQSVRVVAYGSAGLVILVLTLIRRKRARDIKMQPGRQLALN